MHDPNPRPPLLAALARHWPGALACLWFPVLYGVTLTPRGAGESLGPEPFASCIVCGDRGGADFMLNVVLFVPLGLLLARRFGVLRTFALGAALSTGIELIQLLIPGRYSTAGDIVSNAAGALVGAALYRSLDLVARDVRPRAAVGLGLGAFAGALVLLGGWLAAPSPTGEVYFGQRTPQFATRYAGTVLDARLDGRTLPNARLPEDWDARAAMLGDWSLDAVVEKGPAPPGLVSVVSIYDAAQNEIVYLGAYREHLLLREGLRAQHWRLARPELVAWHALAPVAVADTMRLTARRVGHDRCLSVNAVEVCGLGFTPGRLWSLLLYPSSAPWWLQRLADAGLMFALFLPLGLYARSARVAWASGGAAALVLAVAVAATRLSFDPVLEPLAALAGLGAGRAAASALRRAGLISRPGSSPPASPEPG